MPTVLVVDDDPAVRRLLALYVTRLGAAALEAPDGASALAQYRGQAGAIDLVLLDVNLPGMTGPEVLAELRRIDPGVCCVFVTGAPGGLAGLGAEVLHKPLRLADLEESCGFAPTSP